MISYMLPVFICFGLAFGQEIYSTKYDDINLDEVLGNDRLYQTYFDCLTNKGKCLPDGQWLRDILPEAFSTSCAKCSEKQKIGVGKVIKFLKENKPEDFGKLTKLYDPDGSLRKKHNEDGKVFGFEI